VQFFDSRCIISVGR